jgi:hypothetical protein
MALWPAKPMLTLAALAALLAAPHAFQELTQWRLVDPAAAARVIEFTPRAVLSTGGGRPLGIPMREPSGVVLIEDLHESLDPFYADLLRTERNEPGAVTRILHYGDSPTTADLITADLRQLLQNRFGDAGHGVHLIAKPWAWYEHRDVAVTAAGWQIAPATQRLEADGWYGLAGVSFKGGEGAWSRFRLKSGRHTRVVVHYSRGTEPGEMTVLADGRIVSRMDTTAGEVGSGRWPVDLPMGTTEVEARVVRGSVRLFGVSFESSGPGLVYDSLGLNGVSALVLAHFVNEDHWAAQLQAAKPSLIVLNYGTNESGFGTYVRSSYREDLRRVIQRLKRAVPEAGLLVMSPMDRGVREETGRIGTISPLPRLVEIQREVAREQECAFFNTFEAMGGAGTMGRWYEGEPRLVSADFIHPLPAGGRIIADLVDRALMRGYNQYKMRLLGSMQSVEAGR